MADKKKDKVKKRRRLSRRSPENTEKRKKAAKAAKASRSWNPRSLRFRPPSPEGAAYADGSPLDRIQYLEAKLILKPDRFTSVQSFRDFGKLVQQTAKKTGVGFIEDAQAGQRPLIREIIFGDTPDFRFYNNAFILRRRVSYVDGFPVGDPEVVFKFRHPDEQMATKFDVRPKIAGHIRSSSRLKCFL